MRIGLVLCGAGHRDGSEIHEAVIAMLALQEAGAEVLCLAPDLPQAKVINHLSGAAVDEQRSMIHEAARIARGQIKPLGAASPADFDALVMPGGFGAAMNLCDFADKGDKMQVNPDLERLLIGMHEAKKPIGAICIAPVILAKVFGRSGARVTIGNDAGTAAFIAKMGATHIDCSVDGIAVDSTNLLVTTPAYMLGTCAKDIHKGIRRLADEVVRLAKSSGVKGKHA